MKSLSTEFVRPLGNVQNEFLQVLLDRFELRRSGGSAKLSVSIDEHVPAIWLRAGGGHVRSQIPDFEAKSRKYQDELESLLVHGRRRAFTYANSRFPFRFISGGTLPVVSLDGKDYYCLFYREVPPVGWNIANGMSESRHELLDPFDTVERELREELIIFDPAKKQRYVFDTGGSNPGDRPEYVAARNLWRERARAQRLPRFDAFSEVLLPINMDGRAGRTPRPHKAGTGQQVGQVLSEHQCS